MYFLDYKGLIRVACVSGALVSSCFPTLVSAQRQSSEGQCIETLRSKNAWFMTVVKGTLQMGMPAHHIADAAAPLFQIAEGECRDAVRANPELQGIVANARTRVAGGSPANQNAQGSARSDSVGTISSAECFEKIKDIQSRFAPIESLQRQKALFEGECRYHAQAKAYVDAADKGLREQQAGNQTNTGSSTQRSNAGKGQLSAAAQAEALTRERAAGKKAGDDAYATGRGGTTTFLDPRTGKPCITQSWADIPHSDKYVYMRFTNTCGKLYVSVTYKDGRGGPGGFVIGERDFNVSKEQARGGFSYKVYDKL